MSSERDITGIVLAKGGHRSPDDGLCLMEAVAYIRGIPHTDNPPCVSPILGQFGRQLNDLLPQDTRQRLIPLIPSLPGTASDGLDEQRGYLALDWLVRTWLPAWLDLVPSCTEDATALRALGRIVDIAAAQRTGPVVKAARDKAAAGDAAADAAAGDAPWLQPCGAVADGTVFEGDTYLTCTRCRADLGDFEVFHTERALAGTLAALESWTGTP